MCSVRIGALSLRKKAMKSIKEMNELILADSVQKETKTPSSKPPTPNKKIQNDLSKLTSSKEELDVLQKSLDSMLDVMTKNQSILTRAASFWSELPTWQKIIAGIILIVPCFVIGIMASIAVLITISIFALITYTASAFLLNNHYNHSQKATEDLKVMVKGMAGVLMKIIEELGALQEEFKQSIDVFIEENKVLANHTANLSEQVTLLTEQTAQLGDTELMLRTIRAELDLTTGTLVRSMKEHTELLQRNQAQLENVQKNYELSQNQLSEKIIELKAVKAEMTTSNEQLKAMLSVLNGTIETLSGTVIGDKEQRAAFQERLNQFLTDKEASFDLVATRICEAERKLTEVVEQLNNNNRRYDGLLNRHEEQVVRLEGIGSAETAQNSQISAATALNRIGFYASNNQEAHLLEPQIMHHTAILAH